MQRGNNRQMIFRDAADHEFMLGLLTEQAKKLQVEIHAYVLMGNHFHLLATPQTQDGLPLMMQSVGRSYVRYFNRPPAQRHAVEGATARPSCSPSATCWPCMGYIDLNLVRAGLVAQRATYPGPATGIAPGLRTDPLVTPHALFWSLGNTPFRARRPTPPGAAGIVVRKTNLAPRPVHAGWALGGGLHCGVAETDQRRVPRCGWPPCIAEAAEKGANAFTLHY